MSLTDANGNETSSYSYDPFGIRVAGAGGAEAMFQFASGYRMPNGLYHFGQRYYDPVIGRFTQQDPLDQVADLRQANRYIYAGDDPVNLVDPSGAGILDDAFKFGRRVAGFLTAPGLCYAWKYVTYRPKNSYEDGRPPLRKQVRYAYDCTVGYLGETG